MKDASQLTKAEQLLAELQKDFGQRAYSASEAPPLRVISSGITSLDIATGVGGYPRRAVSEIYGRPSTGKTGMAFAAIAHLHQQDPNSVAGWVNTELVPVDKEWATNAYGLDPNRLICVDAKPNSESVEVFGKMAKMQQFDLLVFDSVGAMSTDKELEPGEKKQAFGQSAMVTQLIKQAKHWIYDNDAVALILNHVRADENNPYEEKAPGGFAKEHGAVLRIYTKSSNKDKVEGIVNGEKIQISFRVTAKVVKNMVGPPRQRAAWNFWNYPSPEGVVGIDTFQDSVDVALRMGVFDRAGAWYKHDRFPGGKLNGGVAVTQFLRDNPEFMEDIRREMVMKVYRREYAEKYEREVLADIS